MFEALRHIVFLVSVNVDSRLGVSTPGLFYSLKIKPIQMENQIFEERLKAIGEQVIKVMAVQACARIRGYASPEEVNAAAAGMTIATRTAGKILRELAEADDQESIKQTNTLLAGCPACINEVIRFMADGHLALNFTEPSGL